MTFVECAYLLKVGPAQDCHEGILALHVEACRDMILSENTRISLLKWKSTDHELALNGRNRSP